MRQSTPPAEGRRRPAGRAALPAPRAAWRSAAAALLAAALPLLGGGGLSCGPIHVAQARLGDSCSDDQPCEQGACIEQVCMDTRGLPCRSAADCDDGDPKTRDECPSGWCVHDAQGDSDGGDGTCAPRCDGRSCGADGCGGSCGACAEGLVCGASGLCLPKDAGTCDPATCPPLAGFDAACNASGHCEYVWGDPGVVDRRGERVVWIPPSEFGMGDDDAGTGAGAETDEPPDDPVGFPSGYWIDRYPVTAAAFAAFLNGRRSNDCGAEDGGKGPCVDPFSPTANVRWDPAARRAAVAATCQAAPEAPPTASCGSHPVLEVTWYGARDYCAARGRRLCSEAEWERAARGTERSVYPWGAAAPGAALANCGEGLCADGFERTAPVGRFPDGRSPVGCDDMAGNVWEWVEDDWHARLDGAGRPTDGRPWVDAPRGKERVLRGGSFEHGTAGYLRTTNRFFDGPGYSGVTGVRCCQSLEGTER